MVDRTVLNAGLAQLRWWPLALVLLQSHSSAAVTGSIQMRHPHAQPVSGHSRSLADEARTMRRRLGLPPGGSYAAASGHVSHKPPPALPQPAGLALALAGLACIRGGAWLKVRSGRAGPRHVSP